MRAAVLLAERRFDLRVVLARALQTAGLDVIACACWNEARRHLSRASAVCLGDLGGNPEPCEGIRHLRAAHPGLPVVMWLPERTEALLLQALRSGAADFFRQDDSPQDVAAAVRALIRTEPQAARPPVTGRDLARIVGTSAPIRDLRAQVLRLAASDCNVLITGETGSGKDLAAELIHANSRRAAGPYVAVNCAAFPDSLLESELFGYDRGAFTGANVTHRGKLEYAAGGTVFLDEIGEMSPYAQAKILRAIESRQIERLGGNAHIALNVRIIAATNQNLNALVARNAFRGDLFFRLNVARLSLPPLRDRRQDIPALLEHYIGHFNGASGAAVRGWTGSLLDRLMQHDWPGNIRELRNLVEAIFVNPPDGSIGPSDLPDWFCSADTPRPLEVFGDRERLIDALNSAQWNKSKAAEKLKWSRMTLYRKMSKYGIAAGVRVMAVAAGASAETLR